MVVDICIRCNNERLLYGKIRLCNSCYVSLRTHERTVKGLITEAQRKKKNKYSREYYVKNKKVFGSYAREYYKKNKRKYKSRDITNRNREIVLSKFKYKCVECPKKSPLEIHHLKYDLDFEEIIKNVVVYCRTCHRKKHRLSEVAKHKS